MFLSPARRRNDVRPERSLKSRNFNLMVGEQQRLQGTPVATPSSFAARNVAAAAL